MKSDSEETGYNGEDEVSVISDDELETENEETPSERSSIDEEESDEDSEIGQNENIWLDFLNEFDPEQENGKLKTVKKLYTNLLSKSEMLDNDKTHKLIMRTKRKFDGEDDSLIRAVKKRKIEIERSVFSIPEEKEEDDRVEDNSYDDNEDSEEDDDTNKDPDILWHNLLEESKSALYPDNDPESRDIKYDKKMKKAVLKSVMSRYMDLVEQSEIMKRDSVHKAIQRTKLDLLSQHKDELYSKAKYDKDEALEKALSERATLIKKALLADDDDDGDEDTDNDEDEDSDGEADSSHNEQWLLDIFNESIMEKYDIEDVEEKAQEILNDENALEEIIPLIRKKYLNIVLLIEQLKNSPLHDKVTDMFHDEDSEDEVDSDDEMAANLVELSKKEKWKQAIKKRSFVIMKTIKKHWEPNDDETEEDTDNDEENHVSQPQMKIKI